MTSSTSLIISGSRALVGSSKSMILGFIARARAMATRCCCPPESLAGIDVGLLGDADASELCHGDPVGFFPAAAPHDPLGQADVLQSREVGEQVEELEDHPDLGADPVELLADPCARRSPSIQTSPLAGSLQVVDAAQQRGLAAAAGADDDHHLAAFDLQIDAVQGVHAAAEVLVKIADFDDRLLTHVGAAAFPAPGPAATDATVIVRYSTDRVM